MQLLPELYSAVSDYYNLILLRAVINPIFDSLTHSFTFKYSVQSNAELMSFFNYKVDFILKEQCHEDFAVLGQFCAKIITLRL